MADIGVGIIGLGRIGALHAEQLQRAIKGAQLVGIAVDPEHRRRLEASGSAPAPLFGSVEDLIQSADVEAVVIASSSNAHCEHIVQVAAAGIPMFCEKPLADTVEAALDAVHAVEEAGAPFQIGFQRRFDPGYARAGELVAAGAIGKPELFRGISSDHMPSVEYLQKSGGLFWDLGVHDFDAARFLMGDEIVAVHATGAVQIEPALAAFGDVDYGVITLRFRAGALGVVQNSWRAPWGYEIRAEVCGSEGRVVTELDQRVPTWLYTSKGFTTERYHQFVERFRDAYRIELQAFIDALQAGTKPTPDERDGLRAIEIADAATRSRREDRWIEVGR